MDGLFLLMGYLAGLWEGAMEERKSSWICCADKLPDPDVSVIGEDDQGNIDIYAVTNDGRWYWPNHCECCAGSLDRPVYWQPLPNGSSECPPEDRLKMCEE